MTIYNRRGAKGSIILSNTDLKLVWIVEFTVKYHQHLLRNAHPFFSNHRHFLSNKHSDFGTILISIQSNFEAITLHQQTLFL